MNSDVAMNAIKVAEKVYWVGAVDWNIRDFHGYSTHRGTTYNAYLILDDHVALVDTVKANFSEEMMTRIESVVDPEKIEYVVCNHVEMDHSGAVPQAMETVKNAKVICTERGKEGLAKHYRGDWQFATVKTGGKLNLGKRNLSFIEAPMLHWPDSMFTYLVEDRILMPNDAFGQHIASSGRFDDEVPEALDEAEKYYANILMPFGSLIQSAIKKMGELNISPSVIAPSHGVIWRSDPQRIVNSYDDWSSGRTKPKVLVVYDSMWGSTEKMARAIAENAADPSVKVSVFHLRNSDRSDVVKEILAARVILLGTSTLNNTMLPKMGSLMTYLSGLRPKNKAVACFGSYGWGGGGVRTLENQLKALGLDVFAASVEAQYIPGDTDLEKCGELGKLAREKAKAGL